MKILIDVDIVGLEKPFVFKAGAEKEMLVWNNNEESSFSIQKVSSFNGKEVVTIPGNSANLNNTMKPIIYDNCIKITPQIKELFEHKKLHLKNI